MAYRNLTSKNIIALFSSRYFIPGTKKGNCLFPIPFDKRLFHSQRPPFISLLLAEDAIRHPPKVVLVENVFLIPNPNHYPNPNPKPNPKPNFGYQ